MLREVPNCELAHADHGCDDYYRGWHVYAVEICDYFVVSPPSRNGATPIWRTKNFLCITPRRTSPHRSAPRRVLLHRAASRHGFPTRRCRTSSTRSFPRVFAGADHHDCHCNTGARLEELLVETRTCFSLFPTLADDACARYTTTQDRTRLG